MKIITLLLSFAIALCLSACGEAAVPDTAASGKEAVVGPAAESETSQAAKEQMPTSEHKGPKGIANGDIRGGNGGPGGGMRGRIPTDPEIQAVLDENAGEFDLPASKGLRH